MSDGNYKTFIEYIKEGPNKLIYLLFLYWKTPHCKDDLSPKLSYRHDVYHNPSTVFLEGNWQANSKILLGKIRDENGQNKFEMNIFGRLTITRFNTFFKAIVIQTVRYLWEVKKKRIKNLEIYLHLCNSWFLIMVEQ